MAHFEQHCRDCELILGERHESVNRWIDELFRQFGPRHRPYRHHWRGVRDAKEKFGEEGAKAAIVHIVRDCGDVPTARSYEETVLGMVVAPEFLLGSATEQAQENFRQAVEKALEKGRRDGILAGSSVAEQTLDKRQAVGSTPTPPTKFEQHEEPDFRGMNGVCCQ